MLPLLLGLTLILVSSIVKVVRVARTSRVPVAMRGGAVLAWLFGTLTVAVLPAFAALAILDLATDLVRLDGGLEQLGAATLWIGIGDVANIGRLVAPRPEERGTDADLTKDRGRLAAVAVVATAAYTVALLIAVGFVDDGHIAPGVAVALGLIAAAATVRARPGGPGMGRLTRRPAEPGTGVPGGQDDDADRRDRVPGESDDAPDGQIRVPGTQDDGVEPRSRDPRDEDPGARH